MASLAKLTSILSVGAAALILSTVAYVSLLNGKGAGDQNTTKGIQETTAKTSNYPDAPISAVPEANTGLVMIPFVGAVLVCSSLQLLRLKAQKSGSRS